MSLLKGVAVGVGYFSQFHYEAWNRNPYVEIAAICDLDLDAAKRMAEKWNIPSVYGGLDEMLQAERPDFVDIITPPETHLTLIKIAAAHHVDIICQKPLAPTLEEVYTIDRMVNESGIRFMVHENFRFQPWYRKIKELLNDQVLGQALFYAHFRMRTGDGWQEDAYLNRQPYFRKMPRLLIYETGIHFIDTFRYLFGEVASVNAKLRRLNSNIKGEDWGIVNFDFTSGQLGLFDASRYNESSTKDPRYTFGELLIDGSAGSIRLTSEGDLFLHALGKQELEIAYTHGAKNFASDCVYQTQYHFTQALLNTADFETSLKNYLPNILIQEAIYRSAETGTSQSI